MTPATTSDPYGFPTADAERVVATALLEDLGPQHRDVTTLATIPDGQRESAVIVARASGVVAGLPVIDLVLAAVSREVGTGEVEVDLVVHRSEKDAQWQRLLGLKGSVCSVHSERKECEEEQTV